jgi:hypothetical protein
VITDPSGRYALEGYSAVINIILKDDYKGYEVFLSEKALFDPDANDKKYILPINNASATFNYTINKLNFYTKVSHDLLNIDIHTGSNKLYTSGEEIINESSNQDPNLLVKNYYDNYTIGADFYMNPKHTLSFESNASGLFAGTEFAEDNSKMTNLQDGLVTDEVDIYSLYKSDSRSYRNSLFYVGKLNQKNSLNMDFTYSDYKSNYTNEYFADGIQTTDESGNNHRNDFKFYAEFNHTLSERSGIQVGYGLTRKRMLNTFTPNDLNTIPEVEPIEQKFEFTDLRNKFYAYYSFNPNKKLGIKIGAAGETSIPEADGLKTSYFIYQHYLDIKIKPLNFLDINIKYRSSDKYPSVQQANPFTVNVDALSVRTGNPYLSPSVTHKPSVKFNILQGLISVEPYYHFSDNYISEVGTLRDDGIFEYTYDNAGKYRHKGIKASLTIPFGKSLFWQNNADFYQSSIEYGDNLNDISDWSMNSELIYVNKKIQYSCRINLPKK